MTLDPPTRETKGTWISKPWTIETTGLVYEHPIREHSIPEP